MQNRESKSQIEKILKKYLARDNVLQGNYISKTGSSYLVVAYLNTAGLMASNSGGRFHL